MAPIWPFIRDEDPPRPVRHDPLEISTSWPCAICKLDGHAAKASTTEWTCPSFQDPVTREEAEDAIAVKQLLLARIMDRNSDMVFSDALDKLREHPTWGYIYEEDIMPRRLEARETVDRAESSIPSSQVIRSLYHRLYLQSTAMTRLAHALSNKNIEEDGLGFSEEELKAAKSLCITRNEVSALTARQEPSFEQHAFVETRNLLCGQITACEAERNLLDGHLNQLADWWEGGQLDQIQKFFDIAAGVRSVDLEEATCADTERSEPQQPDVSSYDKLFPLRPSKERRATSETCNGHSLGPYVGMYDNMYPLRSSEERQKTVDGNKDPAAHPRVSSHDTLFPIRSRANETNPPEEVVQRQPLMSSSPAAGEQDAL